MTRKRSNVYATDVQRDVMWRPKTNAFRIQCSRVSEQALLASKRSCIARTQGTRARATMVWRPREGTYSRHRSFRDLNAHINPQPCWWSKRKRLPSDGTTHPLPACIRGQPTMPFPRVEVARHASTRAFACANTTYPCEGVTQSAKTCTCGPAPAQSYVHAAAGFHQHHCPR
jgi:hypothetical protein